MLDNAATAAAACVGRLTRRIPDEVRLFYAFTESLASRSARRCRAAISPERARAISASASRRSRQLLARARACRSVLAQLCERTPSTRFGRRPGGPVTFPRRDRACASTFAHARAVDLLRAGTTGRRLSARPAACDRQLRSRVFSTRARALGAAGPTRGASLFELWTLRGVHQCRRQGLALRLRYHARARRRAPRGSRVDAGRDYPPRWWLDADSQRRLQRRRRMAARCRHDLYAALVSLQIRPGIT